jgi:enoyl-CoA hydratase/carnithine racemase
MLLTGRPVRAGDAVGWLVDYAGPLEQAIEKAWQVATGADHGLPRRDVEAGALDGVSKEISGLPPAGTPASEAGRKAILACIDGACHTPLTDALGVQAKHSAEFMVSAACREGRVGAEYARTVLV